MRGGVSGIPLEAIGIDHSIPMQSRLPETRKKRAVEGGKRKKKVARERVRDRQLTERLKIFLWFLDHGDNGKPTEDAMARKGRSCRMCERGALLFEKRSWRARETER